MGPREYEQMREASGYADKARLEDGSAGRRKIGSNGRVRGQDEISSSGPFLKPEEPLSSAPIEPLLVRPRQAMVLLNCGADYLWKLIRNDDLSSFTGHNGRSRWITTASIRQYIQRQLAASPTSRGRPRRRTPTSSDPETSAPGGATT
jgi:hypothetical protein